MIDLSMPKRRIKLQLVIASVWCALIISPFIELSAQNDKPAAGRDQNILELTESVKLDPKRTYSRIVIKTSNVTVDGQGAWLIGATSGKPRDFKGTAITVDGASKVTLKNLNAKGWETGLHATDCSGLTVENCNFSHNFHDPDFGWGENGRRGGIVLERVTKSTLRRNHANQVWDACVLVNSDENLIEANDFSHTSNTCLKLWTASRNTIQNNILSHGIRISPGEVHARDSTSVLIESGSNGNRLSDNDCTHGGDGIFVRVLNGWCSMFNHFEGNDCSYANNNGVECWAPQNVFLRNKANHCSYGFWLGGSDKTRLIENEASCNGLPGGHHNSPHLPNGGHAGIVFMFGPSSHTLCRGNICRGNNGAGIALVGDLASQGRKWKAYHWIIESNTLETNRWGIYAKHADWIVAAGNQYGDNSVKDVLLDGDVTRFTESTTKIDPAADSPLARIVAERSAQLGKSITFYGLTSQQYANGKASPPGESLLKPQDYTWDIGDGKVHHGIDLEHIFDQPGFYRVGLNVTNGPRTDLAWHDLFVIRDVDELGTEGDAANWSIEDFHDRVRSNQQTSRAEFTNQPMDRLHGKTALQVIIRPYAGFRAALTYPKSRDANWSLAGKKKLVFWLKATNADVTGWQGGPFFVLHGADGKPCYIEPKQGLDMMRNLEHNEGREGWRRMEIPLAGDEQWQTDGVLPKSVRAISLSFDSWGAPDLHLWLDGLAFE